MSVCLSVRVFKTVFGEATWGLFTFSLDFNSFVGFGVYPTSVK